MVPRTVRALLPLLLCLPVLGCAPERTEPHQVQATADQAVIATMFDDAARDYRVPRDLLVAISWSVSRFDARAGEPNSEGGVGLMNLVQGRTGGPDLDLAVALTGHNADVLARDSRLNIRGGAAVLAALGDDWEESTGRALVRIEDWYEVVGELSGAQSSTVRASFSRQVYRFIEGGLEAPTPDGEWLRVESRELDLPALNVVPVSGGADSGVADAYVPAHSSNYSADGRGVGDIDQIVIHTVQGSYAGAVSWFANSAASATAHYTVRSSDGEITQSVRERDIAWHAGDWDTNTRSIGIEHEGYIDQPETWYTDAMMRSSAELTADLCTRYGIPVDRAHIIAHYEVPGCAYSGGGASCHTDPGDGWDWDVYIDLVAAYAGTGGAPAPAAAGDLVGYIRAEDAADSRAGIAGATVTLSTGDVSFTDSDGWYTFTGVISGGTTVTATAAGFTAGSTHKDVQAGITNWQSLALFPSGGASASSPPGAATALLPNEGGRVNTEEAALRWHPTGGEASDWDLQIYYWDGQDWTWYYQYEVQDPTATFWPQVDQTWYAWRVRGSGAGGDGPWSDWAWFEFAG